MVGKKYLAVSVTCSTSGHHSSLFHSPEELQVVRRDFGGPGREPAREDSPGPWQSPLGSEAPKPDPAADSPPTVHPSSSLTSPDLKLRVAS